MAQEQPQSIVQTVSAILNEADEESPTGGIVGTISFDPSNPVQVGELLGYCTIQITALRKVVGELANAVLMLQRQQFPK